MKVIDLLNKIANGEEVPEKVLYKNKMFRLDDHKHYMFEKQVFYTYQYIDLFDETLNCELDEFLNDEVELNKKLEKGMYVRSKINGMIRKITDIEQFEELGQIVERYILDNNYNVGFCSTEKDSMIASHNIIDLIEVGDYVNGQLVYEYLKGTKIYLDGGDYGEILILEDGTPSRPIKSIVTSQQFESMSYKIGD